MCLLISKLTAREEVKETAIATTFGPLTQYTQDYQLPHNYR